MAVPAVMVLLFFSACKRTDGYNYIVSDDKTKPGVPTGVTVDNFKGGAYLTYTLPTSENLLYIMAEYRINDNVVRQVKSSYYSDTIKVEGFAKSQDYDVTLYAVSRAEVKSDPVMIKVHPDTPPYLVVFPTLDVVPDFGGLHVTSTNVEQKPIGVVVITLNSNNEWEIIEQVYTDDASVDFSVRGYDPVERQFGIYITDAFGNISDTLFKNITPIYEQQFDKSKFMAFPFASDAPDAYGWVLANIWNNSTLGAGFHTPPGLGMPQTFTFDMGVRGKLSRYKKWDRYEELAYGAFSHGNVKRWALWGSNEPSDEILPANVSGLAPGQQVGSWIFIGYAEDPPKPSGLPIGTNTAEDVAITAAGFEYAVSLDVPPVRYIRFQSFETFGGGDFIHLMEMTLWGTEQ